MCTCKAAPSVCTVHSAFAARWAEFDAREDVAKREWEEDNANARTRKALLAAEERIDHLEYENKTREEEREEAIEKAADLANLLDQEREEHGAWVKAAYEGQISELEGEIDDLKYENKNLDKDRAEAIEKAADLANLLDQEREEHGAWVKAACAYLTKEQIEACNRAASGKPSKKKRGAA